MMMAQERRKAPRYACRLDVLVSRPNRGVLRGHTADLSRSGVSFDTSDAMVPGDRTTFHLRLVLGWEASDFLRVGARVVRCEPNGDGTFRVGAEFQPDVEAWRVARLEILLRVLAGELDFEFSWGPPLRPV